MSGSPAPSLTRLERTAAALIAALLLQGCIRARDLGEARLAGVEPLALTTMGRAVIAVWPAGAGPARVRLVDRVSGAVLVEHVTEENVFQHDVGRAGDFRFVKEQNGLEPTARDFSLAKGWTCEAEPGPYCLAE